MRAELPSPGVRASCSMVPATSASTTSYAREVSSEEIGWTSASRALSRNSGRPWTRGTTEASAAFISASWATGFAMLTSASVVPGAPASAIAASVVPGAPAPAAVASAVLGVAASVASASEARGASTSVASATEGASAPFDSRASASRGGGAPSPWVVELGLTLSALSGAKVGTSAGRFWLKTRYLQGQHETEERMENAATLPKIRLPRAGLQPLRHGDPPLQRRWWR
ncbi:uncharacterized protein [Miscanthus floridulus]|uniref:uncharacterized protein n=1 Tax=Miscanthus floridulus TaxID=154761 RepID=UPI00345A9446